MINKDTQLCISLSSSPGNFGSFLHNAAFKALGLNYIYKSFGISNIKDALIGVRALNIRGCSVSMPFKESVLPLLDKLDQSARLIGAVNTIVNNDGELTGFNTDQVGARKVLENISIRPSDKILLLGAGGVSRAILFALKEIGCDLVYVSNRDSNKINSLNSILPCQLVPWEERHTFRPDLVINATPVGMNPNIDQSPMDVDFLFHVKAVMDVVVSPVDTRLISLSRSLGKIIVPGYMMSLEQAMEQFSLYTCEDPPREVMEQALNNIFQAD